MLKVTAPVCLNACFGFSSSLPCILLAFVVSTHTHTHLTCFTAHSQQQTWNGFNMTWTGFQKGTRSLPEHFVLWTPQPSSPAPGSVLDPYCSAGVSTSPRLFLKSNTVTRSGLSCSAKPSLAECKQRRHRCTESSLRAKSFFLLSFRPTHNDLQQSNSSSRTLHLLQLVNILQVLSEILQY